MSNELNTIVLKYSKLLSLLKTMDEELYINTMYFINNKYGVLGFKIDLDVEHTVILANNDFKYMDKIINLYNEMKATSWEDYLMKIFSKSIDILEHSIKNKEFKLNQEEIKSDDSILNNIIKNTKNTDMPTQKPNRRERPVGIRESIFKL